MELQRELQRGSWSIALVCMVLGFMISMQFRSNREIQNNIPMQRIEELSARLIETEKERDELRDDLRAMHENQSSHVENDSELRIRAGLVALRGEGIIIRLDDSSMTAKAGENPNVYIVHDDDILRVVNELRAAGAEAISINEQRLIDTSEIRCSGPTLSVNNVRSSSPFLIHAIGDKKSLENSIKMRGGVADTLKVWGIHLEMETSDNVIVPAFNGTVRHKYSKVVE